MFERNYSLFLSLSVARSLGDAPKAVFWVNQNGACGGQGPPKRRHWTKYVNVNANQVLCTYLDLQNELQQLILKSFGDNSLPKGVTSPFSISGAGATFQDFINDRGVANNKDSLQNGAGDEDKR